MSFIRLLWRTLRFAVFDLPKWILILAGLYLFLHYAAQSKRYGVALCGEA